MLNSHDNEQLIRRFLAGELREKELAEFQDLLQKDPELRNRLDAESGTEALVHDAAGSPAPDIRYKAIVDRTVGTLDTERRGTGAWLKVYAVAATLLLMVLGGYALRMRSPMEPGPSVSEQTTGSPVHIRENAKSITRLARNAVLVSEQGTKAQVMKRDDGSVQVVIAQGNAFFDVASLDGSELDVVTPHSAMTLHGTVFRVVVTELETEISVLEGAVEVVHRNHLDSPRLLMAGVTGFADFSSLQTAQPMAPEMCERRKSLLRTYVGWVQEQMNG